MPEAVIVAATRSAIGRAFKGRLAETRPDDLAVQVARAALDSVPEMSPAEIEDLLVGCGEPYDEQGANIARRIGVLLGLDGVPGTTVTRFCASSLQSTRMAFHAIRAGEGDVFMSVGVECVSRHVDHRNAGVGPIEARNPIFASAAARTQRSARGREGAWEDPRTRGELPDVYISMGLTAENVARSFRITRAEQDEFALLSQRRAASAIADGFFEREITPVTLPDGTSFDEDESPRPATSADRLAGLEPAFRPNGTVTAGNCCPLNDGAAALIIMSDRRAHELGISPLARIVSTGVSALTPELMGLGPVEASRRALSLAGMTTADLDLVEMNEAFAAQTIPSCRALGLEPDRVNLHGGAIALGHPFGMTGARITATL